MTFFRTAARTLAGLIPAVMVSVTPVLAQATNDPPSSDVFISGVATNNAVSETLWHLSDPTNNYFGTRQRAPLQLRTREAAGDSGWNAFAQVNARTFVGDVDGNGRDVTLGIDRSFGAARVGLLLTDSTYDLTDATAQQADSDALSYGLYALAEFNETWFVQAFALQSDPDYVVGANAFEADRTAGGLTVGTGREMGALYVTGFASINGYSEDHPVVGITPARTISSTTISIGSRAYFQPSTTAIGYVGLALQHNSFDDGLGNDDDSISPRLSTGYEVQAGPGTFAIDADLGEVVDGTTDIGVSVGYFVSF
ncbi:MAG: hypothetical protein AAFN94_11890 [Pseudomonadota bacterium]